MDPQTLFDQARELHSQGDLPQAERIYRQVLQAAPGGFGVHYMLGVLQSQQGRNAEALASYQQALSLKPDFAEALYNGGTLLWQMRRHNEALAAFDRLLALTPKNAGALFNRGVVLAELTRFEEAVEAYDKALAVQPDFAQALGNRAIALWKLRLFEAALESCDKALAIQPDDVATLYNRGLVLADMKQPEDAITSFAGALALAPDAIDILASQGLALFDLGRFEEAVASYDRVLALDANNVETLSNRGLALSALNRPDEALASYDKAVTIQPRFAPAWNNRAMVLKALSRHVEALHAYDQALALDQNNVEAWNARGSVLRGLGRFEDAVNSYNAALNIRPSFAEARNNRAYVLWADLGLLDAARFDLEKLLTIDPDFPDARGELFQLRMYGGDWNNYAQEAAALDAGVRAGRRVVRPFIYQAISQSPEDLQKCSRVFAEAMYPAMAAPKVKKRRAGGKIKLGYLSSDFRDQATADLTAGLYEMHDRDKFELVAIDSGRSDDSAMRKRLEAAFDKFVPIAGMADEAAAETIRDEKIDILINLNGYFGTPRMGVFARRAAPLQVNYLGFPATLGAPYIDYILADRIVIPEGERKFYTEQVVWLPDTYQVNDSKRAIGDDTSRVGQRLPQDAFVFCNFNQSYKLTPDTFALWMRILKQSEGSVLWLLDSFPAWRENLGRTAQKHGVAPERLIFAPYFPAQQHLARLKLADLFLDSLPYNAHTTASDALWAGLPLLTLRGTAFPGRVAASLLTAAKIPELVTETPEAFEKLAVELANDKAALAKLRAKLGKNRTNCPLFDTARFTRHIEAAFTTMWERHQQGEAPGAFAVEPPA
jgi:protein O-GlcNAc transferase